MVEESRVYLNSGGGFCTATRHGPSTWDVDALGWCYLALVVAVWASSLAIGFVSALSILTYVGLLLAIVGIPRPALGLLSITTLCTLDSIAQLFVMSNGVLRWNTVNYLLLFVMAMNFPLLLRLRDPHTRLVQLLVIVLLAGILFSSDMFHGFNDTLGVITVFGLVAYFSRAMHLKRAWHWVGVVNGSLSAVGGLVYFLQYENIPSINPNAWSYFPLTGIFCICLSSLAAGEKGSFGPITWLLVFTNAGWIYLSGSRGAMLVAACCIVYLTLQIPRVSHRAACIVVLALMGILLSYHFADRWERGQTRVELLLDSDTSLHRRTSGRSEIAVAGVRMFVAHPLGIGTGGFRNAWSSKEYTTGLHLQRKQVLIAHSGWVKVLAENGIPGIAAFLAYVLSFACVGWQRRAEGLLIFGLTITAILAFSFVSVELGNRGIWLIAAGGTAILAHRTTGQAAVSGDRVIRQ